MLFICKFYDVLKFCVIKISIALLITAIIVGSLGSLGLWAKFTQENPVCGIGIAIASLLAVIAAIALRLTYEEYQ